MSGSKRLGAHKDIEKLARLARKAHISVEVKRGSSHLRWTAQNGDTYDCGLTASDPRRIKALKKFLAEHGVNV